MHHMKMIIMKQEKVLAWIEEDPFQQERDSNVEMNRWSKQAGVVQQFNKTRVNLTNQKVPKVLVRDVRGPSNFGISILFFL